MTAAMGTDPNINMMVYNNVGIIGAAIESVLAQTWSNLTLALFDNGSTDGTIEVLRDYASRNPGVSIHRNRCNAGPIANIQRAFWSGDADFVMPKTADDLLAPDYVERLMGVLLAYPECAMCHAAGLVFTGADEVKQVYPSEHRLEAIGPDPVQRACHVMSRYTSAPSFWGIYRRDAVDQLSTIRYRPGFDHAVVAELALYGEVRSVPEVLYWRRGGGKPVMQIGRSATEQGNRGVALDDMLSEHRWRTPLITTAYTHMEVFAAARLPLPQRLALMRATPEVFRARWLPAMRQEAIVLHAEWPALLATLRRGDRITAGWQARAIADTLLAAQTMVPEVDFSLLLLELAAEIGETVQQVVSAGGAA